MSATRLLDIVRSHQIRWFTAGRDIARREVDIDSTSDGTQKPICYPHSRCRRQQGGNLAPQSASPPARTGTLALCASPNPHRARCNVSA
jgi:hypothetical protein